MFTVGIFTTHIPYVAFVVFYAWLLLFGIDKAASGEIETGEKYCKTEWFTEKLFNDVDSKPAQSQLISETGINNIRFEALLFKQKLTFPEYHFITHFQEYYCSSVFCRPPPVA